MRESGKGGIAKEGRARVSLNRMVGQYGKRVWKGFALFLFRSWDGRAHFRFGGDVHVCIRRQGTDFVRGNITDMPSQNPRQEVHLSKDPCDCSAGLHVKGSGVFETNHDKGIKSPPLAQRLDRIA